MGDFGKQWVSKIFKNIHSTRVQPRYVTCPSFKSDCLSGFPTGMPKEWPDSREWGRGTGVLATYVYIGRSCSFQILYMACCPTEMLILEFLRIPILNGQLYFAASQESFVCTPIALEDLCSPWTPTVSMDQPMMSIVAEKQRMPAGLHTV